MSRRRVGAATEPAQQIERLEQPEHRHPPAQLRHRCPVAVRFADVEDDRIFAPLVRGRPACSQAVLEAEIGKSGVDLASRAAEMLPELGDREVDVVRLQTDKAQQLIAHDGEKTRMKSPFHVQVMHGALKVLVPADGSNKTQDAGA